jgi:hypothetical protein
MAGTNFQAATSTTPFLPIYNGPEDPENHIGFVQEHASGFEAFDSGKTPLGWFAAFPSACDVIWADCLGERPRPGQLRAATAAAIAAYETSGRMLDAALAWAAHGFPVFPVTVDKRPVPARDRDVNGKPIPGTGGFKKATTDPIQIRAWWKHHEHLIGLPTGAASGVCCIDVDTSEDHADGVTEWDKLVAQHEPIVTREHRSATDGPHLIFDFDWPTGCSSGQLPKGIEVKGQGGYIVLPPSRRKGRAYTVHHDIDPDPLPLWLRDLITAGRQRGTARRQRWDEPFRGQVTADAEEVTDAMARIRNADVGWDDWKAMALRLYASLGEAGFKLFDAWSQKSSKYDEDNTIEAWEQVIASPPDRTGAGAIFAIARRHGWTPRLFDCAPTYAASDGDADAARRETAERIDAFWERVERYHESTEEPTAVREPSFWQRAANTLGIMTEEPTAPPVEAMRVDTGIGKTEAAIVSHARVRQRGAVATRGIVYTVDRHLLGSKIYERITALGTRAKTFRGRSAADPNNPGQKMCLLLKTRVALARKTHADINKTCCKQGDKVCPLLSRCGYQRQMQGEAPEVWITAHDMLFHAQPAFGRPAAVIIDERMWHKAIRGIEDETEWEVPLDSLITDAADRSVAGDASSRRAHYRNRLGRALMQQDNDGGVERKHLDATLDPYTCSIARRLEWKLIPELGQHPGMSEFEIATLAGDTDVIDTIQHTRRVIQIWEAVGDLLKDPDIEVSGCLTLKQHNGQRVVTWKGVGKIRKQFQVPTLLLDATLPPLPLLRVYYPQVEMAADIKAAMPAHTRICQVLRAPTSSNKLDDEKHLDSMQRTILQRWIETGRQATLVICQQKVEEALQQYRLPANITLAHYNNIAGDDDFKAVRLAMLIGRTAPGPRAMETLAATLSGRQPIEAAAGVGGFAWYEQVTRSIRLRDGRGIKTSGDRHPDPFVEMVRWQVHEGELMQALGRARGVNRTAATPLDIDLLFDTCLPITVDEVVLWRPPSLLYVTAAEGVTLNAPVDMVRLWPDLWPNEKAAYRTIQEGVPALPGFEQVIYQLKGPKMNRRLSHFNRALIPDPRPWLEERLGPLGYFEILEPEARSQCDCDTSAFISL